MSFSSKLLHTIKPEYPIWDSVVTKEHFGIRPPYASCKNREDGKRETAKHKHHSDKSRK